VARRRKSGDEELLLLLLLIPMASALRGPRGPFLQRKAAWWEVWFDDFLKAVGAKKA
jgi:hypothetical protein